MANTVDRPAEARETSQSAHALHTSMASPTIVQTPDVEPNEPRKASIDKRTIEGTNATHSPSSDHRSPAGSAHSCVTVSSRNHTQCHLLGSRFAESGLTESQQVKTIDTAVPARPRSDSDQTPQSVIHAPQGFRQLVSGSTVRWWNSSRRSF